MSLNIKNAETRRLASELANLTGETMTGAITVTLRERLQRVNRERDADSRTRRLLAIGSRCANLLSDGPSATEHGDFVHNEQGQPG